MHRADNHVRILILTQCLHFRLVSFIIYMATECIFIMIKPDVGEIIKRFEKKGFKLVTLKFMQVRFFYLSIFLI